jgi:tRNA-dihydrouridine synthase B
VAKLAEDAGIRALAVHGRARNDFYEGQAEYATIAAVKQSVSIPVIANGDITTPQQALAVFRATGADALMVGRAAQGRPWIFRELAHFLVTGHELPPATPAQIGSVLLEHLDALYGFYGDDDGVRIARKHLGWYAKEHPEAASFRAVVNAALQPAEQIRAVRDWFGLDSQKSVFPEPDLAAIA